MTDERNENTRNEMNTAKGMDGGNISPNNRQTNPQQTQEEEVDIRDLLHKTFLAALVIAGGVVGIQFYTSAMSAIDIWVSNKYAPLFRAGFNLSILLLIAVGISYEIKKIDILDDNQK